MTLLITLLVLSVVAGLFSFDLGWNNVVTAERNDLVFERKNKGYGAFQIRRDYNGILILALLSTVGICTALSVGMRIWGVSHLEKAVLIPIDPNSPMTPPPIDQPVTPPLPQVVNPLPPMHTPVVPQFVFLPPEVTEDVVQHPPHSQEDMNGKKPGSEDIEGPEDGPATPKENPVTPSTEGGEETVFRFVEQNPEFPGGDKAMAVFLQSNTSFPVICKENGIEGTVYVQFVVDRNGNIKDVKAAQGVRGCPDYEREAIRVVKAMPAWKPGRMNGKAVSVLFTIPVSFKLRS
jgi:protein TonB